MGFIARFLRAIVRNDAMRNDPDEIYSWRVIALVCSACFGGMLFGWETGAIGGVLAMEDTQKRFGYADASHKHKATQDQNIVSTLQAGCFLACFLTSWLTEKFGRRWCLIATGALTTAGVICQAGSAVKGIIAVMYVGRFISGLGVGAASTLVPLYVSECAPRAIRGGLISFYQLFIVLGVMLAFWTNYGCLLHATAPAIYIVPLSLQALPAVLLIFGMFLSPESPRWCAKQDDWERATTILVNLRRLPAESDYVRTEIQEMSEQLEAERRLIGDASAVALAKEMFLIPGNRKRTFITITLMICQQMTGVNAVNYYAPQIFGNLGMTGTETSLFATGVYGVVKVVGCAIFLVFAADSLGRRRSLLWTSAAQAVVMFIIGIYGRVEPPVAGKSISPFGYVAITCIYLWAAFYQFGWGPCCWILVSEIPTARLRSMNVALGAATQWLFNFIIARTVLTMQQTMGEAGYGMFFMFGSFCVLMGTFVWFFVPETKGLSLEKMDELFGVAALANEKEADTEKEAAQPRSSHDFDYSDEEWAGQKALCEPFIQNYQKFNSNSGWNDDSRAWGEVMQALSHFSYHLSGGQFVLCDLQGGIYQREIVLSDPVILSRNRDYGVTDLGSEGISSFFSQHSCNNYCRPNWTQPSNPYQYFQPVHGTTMMRHSVPTAYSRFTGTSSLWTGPDGTCLKFSTHAEPIEVLKTDIVAHEEINEVDVGEGLYSCDDYMKLFDLAKEGCTPVGCVTENKACDDQTCVTIDGTTNQGVDDKFKGYLDQLRGVIAGSCKTEAYQDYYCTPNGVCSTNKRVKVQIPSFIGSSTSKDKGLFVANYKVTFTQKERKSACDIITALLSAVCIPIDLLSADPRVGAIVLTSSNQRNRMFCAGLDFNVPLTLSADRNDYREPAGKVALALYRCTKPVVAAINGSTICVGITMTLPANIRVVSRDAKVGFIFSRRGFSMEACSSFFLPRLVGSGRALHLTTTGSVYPATHQIFDGLFSDVVDPDEVLPTAFRYADEISSNVSGLLARVMKDMIYRNVGSPEETHLLESKIFYDLLKGSDSEEGVQSFMQKRKPDFKATMEKDAPSAWPWWTPVDIKIKERL
ncbi:hypothetical protein CEP54_014231 [Fusarium duplospermum]|uniref:Major facilitator superfamily (MFS) profile domain-containing protein n=1 Tax=Fusarium duplospermum TaxID=1325734 RepID=A0A428NXS8_9HYPO|nr:hypothetical protein CEP54_014231 [Fusarium duplospermum]